MSKDSLTNKTFFGFFWSTGGKVINALAQIAVLVVLARLISPESFGLIQAALIVVGFAKLLSQMGIGPALVQRKELTENHIRVGFTFSLSLGLILGLIIFLSSSYIASFFNIEDLPLVLQVVSLLFVFESFITVSSSLIQRDMRFKELAVIEMISYVFGYGVIGVIFGYLNYDYWALIFAIFAQQIIQMISYAILQRHSLKPLWLKEELYDLIYFGGGFTIAKFFNYFANQGDNIMVGRYLGAESLGVYSRAYAIMSKPVSLIGNSIDKVLFPAMSARQNENKRLINGFINGSRLILLVCLPITFLIYLSAEEIVMVLLGEKWSASILPLQILTLSLYFKMGYKMGDNLCRAKGVVYKRAYRQFFFALAVFIGTYVGAKFWAIQGVAYGMLFAIIFNYILMIGLSIKILNISWKYFIKKISSDLPMLIILSVSFYVIIYLTRIITSSSLFILIISYGVFGIISVTIFYYFGHKLSFLRILPFKDKINKFIKNKL